MSFVKIGLCNKSYEIDQFLILEIVLSSLKNTFVIK